MPESHHEAVAGDLEEGFARRAALSTIASMALARGRRRRRMVSRAWRLVPWMSNPSRRILAGARRLLRSTPQAVMAWEPDTHVVPVDAIEAVAPPPGPGARLALNGPRRPVRKF